MRRIKGYYFRLHRHFSPSLLFLSLPSLPFSLSLPFSSILIFCSFGIDSHNIISNPDINDITYFSAIIVFIDILQAPISNDIIFQTFWWSNEPSIGRAKPHFSKRYWIGAFLLTLVTAAPTHWVIRMRRSAAVNLPNVHFLKLSLTKFWNWIVTSLAEQAMCNLIK